MQTVLTYGTEGWTRTRIESAELWIYRRMLRVSWIGHRTNQYSYRTKLCPLDTQSETACDLVKCTIQGKVHGKRRQGRHKKQHHKIDGWRDRTRWRRLVQCAVLRDGTAKEEPLQQIICSLFYINQTKT